MTVFEAKMGERGIIRVGVDFFFKLNLLPPYSLRSQGIKNNMCSIIIRTMFVF